MKKAKSVDPNKTVKETKKPASDYHAIPNDARIDVVAITQDKTYIFEMAFGQWLKIHKKEGVQYIAYQKGAAQFPDAIRTEYKY